MRQRLRDVDRVTWIECAGLFVMTYVVLWALHPELLLSTSTANGGDMGAHLAMPAYLRDHMTLGNLTPWYPGWFAGMPLYTYYFVLPDILAALGSFLIPATVAFKIATALGSLLMPLSAYVMGRLLRLPRPIPITLAGMILLFLFNGSYTIFGGNMFSALAGEYSYSFSLCFALVTVGLFGRGIREGGRKWLTALTLSATLAAHVLPWFYAITGALVLLAVHLFLPFETNETPLRGRRRRAVGFVVAAGVVSAGLSAWWLVPFSFTQNLTNSMGYTNFDTSSLHSVFTQLGWFADTGGPGPLRPIIALAAIALLWAFATRSRDGIFFSLMAVLSLLVYIGLPQGALWNGRVIPYWYVSVYLAAGWLIGGAIAWLGDRRHDRRLVSWHRWQQIYEMENLPEEMTPPPVARPRVWSPVVVTLLAVIFAATPSSPALAQFFRVTPAANQVPAWSSWNYSGYESKSGWAEYRQIMTTMNAESSRHGCGRAYWEYEANQDRFGTPMALMLLPYWTNNCVSSMEGLTFESSPTVPYHFMVQSELSVAPSRPMVGLPYQGVNVDMGVRHLQMLGVKYFLAFSPSIVSAANASPFLTPLTVIPAMGDRGVEWHIYLVRDAPLVAPVINLPNVLPSANSRMAWLDANAYWWTTPSTWDVVVTNTGPTTWPRTRSTGTLVRHPVSPTVVKNVTTTDNTLSFDVSRVGTPVVVKISYYPRWHVEGAVGPYRASPNFMVVIPTATHVTLRYGSSPLTRVGMLLTFITAGRGLQLVVRRHRRRPQN